jgi:hypothetical protein
MQRDSIVVLESEAAWPAWVDLEAGPATSIVVLGRRRGESLRAFEARARLRLHAMAEPVPPARAILVCGRTGGRERSAARGGVARALVEIVREAGGGEVVVMGEPDPRLHSRLAGHVSKLNREQGSAGPVSIRHRAPPETASRHVA